VAPFALPERYGGTLANDINSSAYRQHDDNMMAFSITTSATDAARKMEEIEAHLA
jgi:hypothetical protein